MKWREYKDALLNAGIEVVEPTILEELPHDPTAYTQGLAFAHGTLFESTGLENESSLRRLDPQSGRVELVKDLPGHWGEGIAIKGELIVQLTWRSNVAIVYTLDDLTEVDRWHFDGEGWGLATSGEGFVMTNGGSELLFRDSGFELVRSIRVRRKGRGLRWLNDLEFARGRLLVHRLGDRYLYEIDVTNGSIQRLVDGRALLSRARPRGREDVFNGIAYDPIDDTFFLTGKRWPTLFRVSIPAP